MISTWWLTAKLWNATATRKRRPRKPVVHIGSGGKHGARSGFAVAHPVRLRHQLPHHLSRPSRSGSPRGSRRSRACGWRPADRSIGACSISGSRSSRCRSPWAWSAASSWRSSSAPTGACWPNAPGRSRGRCSAMRASPPSCWKRHSSASCCSAATGCRRGSTFCPAAWSRSAPCSRRSGFLCNNSWMQVPIGPRDRRRQDRAGRLVGDHHRARSCAVRWPHMLLAAFLTTGMSVIATGAWHLLRGRHLPEARVMLRWGLGLVAVIIPVQIVLRPSDRRVRPALSAGEIRRDRGALADPAAGERSADRAPRSVGGTQPVRAGGAEARQLHRLGQLDRAKEIGLDTFPPEDRPPVIIPFFAFRIMVGHGTDHAGGVLVRSSVVLARPAGARALVSVGGVPVVSERFRRRALRLVHRRGRPPALGGLRPAAHQGCDDAVADDGARCCFR